MSEAACRVWEVVWLGWRDTALATSYRNMSRRGSRWCPWQDICRVVWRGRVLFRAEPTCMPHIVLHMASTRVSYLCKWPVWGCPHCQRRERMWMISWGFYVPLSPCESRSVHVAVVPLFFFFRVGEQAEHPCHHACLGVALVSLSTSPFHRLHFRSHRRRSGWRLAG